MQITILNNEALKLHYLSLISNSFGGFYMKLKPLADRVLVKQEKAETKTASGIIIPETAQEKTQTATVTAVGPGTEKEKMTVNVGDRVMYDKYAGTSVKIDGDDYLIVKMSDIIAVIEK
jgi:chaperonin GroES